MLKPYHFEIPQYLCKQRDEAFLLLKFPWNQTLLDIHYQMHLYQPSILCWNYLLPSVILHTENASAAISLRPASLFIFKNSNFLTAFKHTQNIYICNECPRNQEHGKKDLLPFMFLEVPSSRDHHSFVSWYLDIPNDEKI